jgi:hypothetical protein
VLTGALLVTRYSGGDDLVVLYPDGVIGDIAASFEDVNDFEGFNNPLDVVEDLTTGNLYVSEYGASRISLLRAVDPMAAQTRVDPAELIFSAVVNTTSDPETVSLINEGTDTLTVDALSIQGADPGAFALVVPPALPVGLAPGQGVQLSVEFAPSSVGSLSASLRVGTSRGVVPVGLYGLAAQGLEGSNEPALQRVVDTLGYAIDVGGAQLALGTNPTPIGDELPAPLFTRAGPGPVELLPVARYSPAFPLPFGLYLPDGTTPLHLEMGQLDGSDNPPEHQTLFPNLASGGTQIDVGRAVFGIYTSSPTHQAYSEDELNTALFPSNVAHAVRTYPLKNRFGVPVLHSYLVGFEEASNGDYQDYVFVLSNAVPVSASIRPYLTIDRDSTGDRLDWSPAIGATTYDVATGDLGSLRTSGGNFAMAETACLADGVSAFHTLLAGDPGAGAGSWYLVRCDDCPTAGYDSGGDGQQSPRDPGVSVCP